MPSSACQKCALDRKSTRLNSSHDQISYAVFCLKKQLLHPADGEGHAALYMPKRQVCDRVGARVARGGAARGGQVGAMIRVEHSAVFFFKEPGAHGVLPLSPHGRLPV